MSWDSILLFVYCCISCEKAIKSRNSIFEKIYSPFVFIPDIATGPWCYNQLRRYSMSCFGELLHVLENLNFSKVVWRG